MQQKHKKVIFKCLQKTILYVFPLLCIEIIRTFAYPYRLERI